MFTNFLKLQKLLSVFIFVVFSLSIFQPVLAQEFSPGTGPGADVGSAEVQKISDQYNKNLPKCERFMSTITSPVDCGLIGSIFSGIFAVLNWVFARLLGVIADFTGWLAGLTGWLMDYMIYFTVVQYADNFTKIPSQTVSAESGGLIYYIWTLFRDLLNAGVFFIIMYHAVLSMFNGFTDIKKKFFSLLLFVIMVNFSLLFVKLCIDVSNIATLTVYNMAVKPSGSDTWTAFSTPAAGADSGKPATLSSFILQSINPSESMNSSRADGTISMLLNGGFQSASYQLGRIIMYALLFIFFIYIAGIFLTRAVTFVIIMMFSPLLVAGSFFENKKIKEAADKLKGELFEESVQGPAIIFFLVISSLIAYTMFNTTENFLVASAGITELTEFQKFIAGFIKIGFFMIFNFYGINAVRELTSRGGYLSEKLTGFALGGGIYGLSWMSRKGLGYGFDALNNTKFGQKTMNLAANENARGAKKWFATKYAVASNNTQNGTFNPINTKMGKNLLKMTNATLGTRFDIKGPQKSNRDSAEEAAKKILARYDAEKSAVSSMVKDYKNVTNEDILRKGLVKTNYSGKETSSDEIYEKLAAAEKRISDAKDKLEKEQSGIDSLSKHITNSNISDQEMYKMMMEHPNQSDIINLNGQSASVKDWVRAGKYNKSGEDQEIVEALKALKEDKELKDLNVALSKAKDKLREMGASDRADLVSKYKDKMKKDIERSMDQQLAEGKRRQMVRDVWRRGLNTAYDNFVAEGEDRTHALDIVQNKASKRFKESESASKRETRVVDTMVKQARRMKANISKHNLPIDRDSLDKFTKFIDEYKDHTAKSPSIPDEKRDEYFKIADKIVNTIYEEAENGNIKFEEADSIATSVRKNKEEFEDMAEKAKKDGAKKDEKKEATDDKK